MAYTPPPPIDIINLIRSLLIDNNTMQINPAKLRYVLEVMTSAMQQSNASAVSAVNPLIFDPFTNSFSINQASAESSGYLSAEDWIRFNAGGGGATNIEGVELDLEYVDSNTFDLPENYILISVFINIALNKKARYTRSGNAITILDTLEVGDVINIRGLVATGEFVPVIPPTLNDVALQGSNSSVTIQSPDAVNANDLVPLGQVEALANSDTIATLLTANLNDLGIEDESEITEQIIADYINSLGLIKSKNEFYILQIEEDFLEVIDLTTDLDELEIFDLTENGIQISDLTN